MRKLLSLLSLFAIVLSCSSDETSTPVTPPPAPIVKYTITLSAGEGGTVSTTGGEYEAGQTVSVTATPQGEYVFTSWSDGNTNATRTITIGSNSTLTANFEKRKYPLTVNFEGEGEVIEEIVNAGRTTDYDSGTTVKLTAQAAAEWVFIGWTGDIESTEESVQIVIGEPKEVTATFEKKKYPLTVNIEGEGEVLEEIVNAGRTTDYDSGTTVKLTAQPEDEWLFTGWSGDIGDIDPTENPIQLSIIESKTVTATFEKKKYPLTVNIEGEGEVLEEIVNAGRTTDYNSGTTVKLTAQPEDEWLFTGWSGDIGDIDPTENPIQLSIIESKTVTATFEKKKYPLTVNIDGEGEVLEEIVNSGRTTDYNSGTTVKLTAQPEDEWLFTGWSGDIGDIDPTENPIQLSIIESKTVTATFEKKKYPLTVNIEGEGEVLEEIVNAGRTTDYDSGTTVKLTAQPADEWLFTGWSGDIGDIDPTENPIQLSIIESKTVTATFEKKKYPLTVNIEGEGEVLEEIVNAGRSTDYNSGTTVKLTAEPKDEWLFTGWSGDIGDIDPTENPIQLSIIESKTVTATFEKKKYPLTVNIDGEGEVLEEIVNAGRSTDYNSGTTVKLTAEPKDEWVFTRWSGDIGDIDPTENPIQLSIIESKTVTATFQIENYFSINVIGNGTYQRPNSPYPPLEYEIELISGNKNENGNYSKGSIIRLSAKENPGWQIDYSQINRATLNQDIIVEDNLEFKLNVIAGFAATRDTFPFNELNSDGSLLNVGSNIGAYAEWNEPNSELNYYITDNFMYPEYVEEYKDRIFEIRQLLGEWGPLDILIYDWEQNPVQNREMWLETRETLAAEAYRNQLIGNVQNWVNQEMEYYDEAVLNNGWPFGSAYVGMGYGRQIGQIFKNKNWDYLKTWANGTGLEVADLIQTEEFNWEFDSGAYHEYIHVWQGSQNKHGFVNTIAGCYNCNTFSDKDPNLNRIWVAPRWFQEGQCNVIQSILSEKMELRAEQNMCCNPPRPIFNVRNYIEKELLGWAERGGHTGQKPDRLVRIGEGITHGYGVIGDIASWYKFAKMNYSLETYMAFETHRGAYGYASALQAYLGMSEDEFYTTFNNWFFDSNLSSKEKLDYLYPEGINPIQMDILKRR